MLLLYTALQWEADPLIERFGLQRSRQFRSCRLFVGERTALLCGGVGRAKTVQAIAALAAELRTRPLPEGVAQALNIGTCGAVSETEVGTLCRITEIIEYASRRSHRLEPPPLGSISPVRLYTFEAPVTPAARLEPEVRLVDMEAAYFAAAVQTHFPTCLRYCIKLVSDRLGDRPFSQKVVARLFEQNMEDLAEIVRSLQNASQPEKSR